MKSNKIDVEKLKKPGISWDVSEKPDNDILQSLGSGKITSIKEAIQEINDLIVQRGELSKEVANLAEGLKTSVENFMLESELEIAEKIALQRKIIEVDELKIKEKIDCWKDIAKLKQELRELVREASERERRIESLNQLMG